MEFLFIQELVYFVKTNIFFAPIELLDIGNKQCKHYKFTCLNHENLAHTGRHLACSFVTEISDG